MDKKTQIINAAIEVFAKQGLENRLVRVPKSLREKMHVSLGELLILDNDVVLQVEEAFTEDIIIEEDDCAFVTSSTLNKVGCEKQVLQYSNSITLGCDPELFLVDSKTNSIVNPNKFFNKWNAIGTDGFLCELRPMPSTTADGVTEKLKRMIREVRTTLDKNNMFDTKILCKSNYGGISAGFHCHMGLPKEMLDESLPNYGKLMRTIVRTLDYYAGLIAIIPEGSKDNIRRCAPHVNYGKVSDHRVDNRTLEYRVPGGIMLRSPELYAGLLELCSMITRDSITRLKLYTDDFKKKDIPDVDLIIKDLYPNIPDLRKMCSLMCVPSTNEAKKHVDKFVVKDLESMFNFDKHKKNIKNLLNVIDTDINEDVNKNWE